MGLISKSAKVKWNGANKKWYESKGYKWTKQGDEFEVTVEELSKGSNSHVAVECNGCGEILHMTWREYNKNVHKDNKCYCKKCASKERIENGVKTRLKNGKSFYDWCLEHNRFDILLRWDFILNMCSPSDICCSTHTKYYFKCPKGIHPSELKDLHNFINQYKKGYNGVMDCIACNSIGQYICNLYGVDKLNYYWDWYKNVDKNGNKLNPFIIARCSNNKTYIYCQEDNNHESYPITCNDFYNGCRCPQCNKSKGEKKIEEYLLKNYFIKKEDNKQTNNKINNKYYIPQKEFEGLLGLGNGNLSYDFYLPQCNLLIEYQGQQHGKYIKGFHRYKKDFKKQLEHDKRKKDYAINKKIKLLEIWYNCYDDIEFILDEVLKLL